MKVTPFRAGQAVVALSAALLLFVPAPASAGSQNPNDPPPNDRITVDVQTVNGSGCPAGTASVSVSPDNTSFRVRYRAYVARTGGGADPTDFRKNCQIALLVHLPQGFTFAIARADYRGAANLKKDASATLTAAYYFQGDSDTLYLNHTLHGPFQDRWQATDITPVTALVFSKCGEDVGFNINSSLRVRSDKDSSNWISMNSTTGDIDTLFHFHWKNC
jgi:hypothetical protein